MKKICITFLGIVMLVVLTACGWSNVDDATVEKYSTKAEEVITLLNNGNYEEVHAMFDATMKTALPVTDMAEFTPILEESGTFESFHKSTVNEEEGFYITVMIVKYSNEDRVFTITFNDAEEIAGLFVK